MSHAAHRSLAGRRRPSANTRLTSSTALALLVLLAAEGVTLLQLGRLLTWHIAIGLALVPPLAVKVAATLYRFVRYYTGDDDYVERGAPHLVLRLLGPVEVLLTASLMGSGLLAYFWHHSGHYGRLMLIHKASFVLWFGTTTIHVLGHLGETLRHGGEDWVGRRRRDVPGSSARQLVLLSAILLGVVLAWWVYPSVAHFTRG